MPFDKRHFRNDEKHDTLYAQDATRFKARDRTGAPQSAAWEQEKRNGEIRMIGQRKNTAADIVVVGFALFSMFFGAGNVIFPPFLGMEAGSQWLTGFSAYFIADIGLAMMDIDHFKKVNDTYGHAAGDLVLKEFASRIGKNIRGVDLAARYGGEEFVAMLPNTNSEGAQTTGERIRKAVENMHIEHKGERVPITCSVGGCTIVPDHDLDKTDLIKFADGALYQAKDQGRNRYLAAEFES